MSFVGGEPPRRPQAPHRDPLGHGQGGYEAQPPLAPPGDPGALPGRDGEVESPWADLRANAAARYEQAIAAFNAARGAQERLDALLDLRRLSHGHVPADQAGAVWRDVMAERMFMPTHDLICLQLQAAQGQLRGRDREAERVPVWGVPDGRLVLEADGTLWQSETSPPARHCVVVAGAQMQPGSPDHVLVAGDGDRRRPMLPVTDAICIVLRSLRDSN